MSRFWLQSPNLKHLTLPLKRAIQLPKKKVIFLCFPGSSISGCIPRTGFRSERVLVAGEMEEDGSVTRPDLPGPTTIKVSNSHVIYNVDNVVTSMGNRLQENYDSSTQRRFFTFYQVP